MYLFLLNSEHECFFKENKPFRANRRQQKCAHGGISTSWKRISIRSSHQPLGDSAQRRCFNFFFFRNSCRHRHARDTRGRDAFPFCFSLSVLIFLLFFSSSYVRRLPVLSYGARMAKSASASRRPRNTPIKHRKRCDECHNFFEFPTSK